jgi:peptide/nickel transport system substrate-binding protein
MRSRLGLAVAFSLVGLTLLAASAALARPSGGVVKNGGTLRVNMSETDVQYLDPALDYDFYGWTVLFATCVRLLSYPDKGGPAGSRLVPEGATAFPKISNGGRTYTFTVRTGYRFNTGEAVTAESYARAVERGLAKKMNASASIFMGDIVGADAVLVGKRARPSGLVVRGNTITFKLTKPAPDFLSRVAMPFFCAQSPSTPLDPKGVNEPAMAGPFYIKERDPGRTILLERNPYYTGPRKARLDRIAITVNSATEGSLLQIEKGEADFEMVGLPPTSHKRLATKYGVNKGRYFVHEALGFGYLALNTTRELTGQVNVRRAINYAIDRTALAALNGYLGGAPTDQILPPGMPGYRDAKLYPSRPNPTRATALLAGTTGTLRLYYPKGPPADQQVIVIQQNLKKVGLDVKPVGLPFDVLLGKIGNPKEPYDMILIGWFADYVDPSNFVDILLNGKRISSSNNNSNLALFDDPTFNRRMNRSSLLVGDARYAAFGKLDVDIMRDAAPLAPIFVNTNRELVSKNVGCYTYVPAYQAMSLATACLK